MLIATTIVSTCILLPSDLRDYASSMVATVLFGANFYFWRTAGYFDTVAESKPLLHAWSLGVEEQFYVAFPLLVTLVYRWKPRAFPLVIGFLGATSLLLSESLLASGPTSSFYLLPTRAWEPLLGVFIAVVPLKPLDWRPIRLFVGLTGFGLIVLSIARYNVYTRFPGLHALIPCLGAAAIIAAGSRDPSPVFALLSIRPVVFIGLMPYSLYLWHWPIIVLTLQ
jgi:peptidoglycan/LPS O-acetylase OafA/YrhL